MLTLIVSRGQHGKMVANQSLYLGSFFSNMMFQNESFESITDLDPPDLPMLKFATCTTLFFQSIKPTPNALGT